MDALIITHHRLLIALAMSLLRLAEKSSHQSVEMSTLVAAAAAAAVVSPAEAAPAAAPAATGVSPAAVPELGSAALAAQAAYTQAAMRSQKLCDQALNWLKIGGSYEKIRGLLVESHQLALATFGEVDLKTARVAWQLASHLLTKGLVDEAETLLLTVQRAREQLLPETSDELFDVFTDLSYVQMFRAQHPNPTVTVAAAAKKHDPASCYASAMSYALRAKSIVSKNANSSTSERYYYRLCLISSRIGGIHRAQGMMEKARECYEEAYATSSRLQLDSEKNVKLHSHAILELAGMEVHMRQLKRAKAKRASAKSDAAQPLAASPQPPPRDISALYQKVITLLPLHNLQEQPFMAQAAAGLALLLMAEAEELHQDGITGSKAAAATTSVAATPSSSITASSSSLVSPLTAQQRHAKIQDLLRRAVTLTASALALYETLFGPDSQDVATMCYNLGGLHVRLDEAKLARPFLERALQIRSKLYGPVNESSMKVKDDIAKLEKLEKTSTLNSTANLTTHAPGSQTARSAPRAPAPPSQAPPAGNGSLSARRRTVGAATNRRGTAPIVAPTAVPSSASSPPQTTSVLSARSSRTMPSGSQSARGTAAAAVKALNQTKPTVGATAVLVAPPTAPTHDGPTPVPPIQVTSAPPRATPLPPSSALAAVVTPSAASAEAVTSVVHPTLLRKAPSQSQLLMFPAAVVVEQSVAALSVAPAAVAEISPVVSTTPSSMPVLATVLAPAAAEVPRAMSRSNSSATIVIPARRASGGIVPGAAWSATTPSDILITAASAVAVPAIQLSSSLAHEFPVEAIPSVVAATSEASPMTFNEATTSAMPATPEAAAVVAVSAVAPKVYTIQRSNSRSNLDLASTVSTSPLAEVLPTTARPSSAIYKLQLRPKTAQKHAVVAGSLASKSEESKQQPLEIASVVPASARSILDEAAAAGIHHDPRLLSF